jgi:hypothetical protein
MFREMTELFKISFEVDSFEEESANTLSPDDLSETPDKDGWIVIGEIHDDCYQWVNYFVAKHPEKEYVVYGDFEHEIVATSKEAYDYFMKCHPPHRWSYGDI